MATTTYIYNNSDVETVQSASSCNEFAHEVEGISHRFNLRRLTAPRTYLRQLRMYRRMAQFIDRHTVLSNLWIGGWSLALFLYIFLHY